MGSWFDVLMLFALIVFNGVFSMSEIALVTSRKARLQVMAEDGNKGAQRAAHLGAFDHSGGHHLHRHSLGYRG